jgi:hypothetical protein
LPLAEASRSRCSQSLDSYKTGCHRPCRRISPEYELKKVAEDGNLAATALDEDEFFGRFDLRKPKAGLTYYPRATKVVCVNAQNCAPCDGEAVTPSIT